LKRRGGKKGNQEPAKGLVNYENTIGGGKGVEEKVKLKGGHNEGKSYRKKGKRKVTML